MRQFTLIKHGDAGEAFELKEKADPEPGPDEMVVEVEAFGINYADVLARKGKYNDAPPLPTVVGYEVVGRIEKVGEDVKDLVPGLRVLAFTRFGGYATKVVTRKEGVVPIPEGMDKGVALALGVQYSTAWYCAEEAVTLHPGDHVLVQAAAGGVGTALVQMAKRRGCIVYGTASKPEKLEYLKDQGVDYPINYKENDFDIVIRDIRGKKGVDVVFDSLGGKPFRKGLKILARGGRMVAYGNASGSDGPSGILGGLKTLFGFGIVSPAFLIMQSRGIIGVNMLRIADHKPAILHHCLEKVVSLTEEGELNPVVGATYKADQLADAHQFIENRNSMGKVIVEW